MSRDDHDAKGIAADTVQYNLPHPDVDSLRFNWIHNAVRECSRAAEHALPKLVGCRVGDGERAACRKGSGCPMLPGPRNEPIMS